jgi:hypothetical protein
MRWSFLMSRLCIAGLLAGAAPSEAGQLLSLDGLALSPNEFVAGFRIDTAGFSLLAVCHLPQSWTIGGLNAPSGGLYGSYHVGAAALSGVGLAELHGLFLIQPFDAAGRADTQLSGEVLVGLYGDDRDPAARPLSPRQILLTPADRCPDPRR